MTGPVIAAVVGLGLYAIAMTWLVVYMASTASGKATGSHHREDLRPAVRPPGPERPVPARVTGTGPALPVEVSHDDPGHDARIRDALDLMAAVFPVRPSLLTAPGKPALPAADETAIDMTAIGDQP